MTSLYPPYRPLLENIEAKVLAAMKARDELTPVERDTLSVKARHIDEANHFGWVEVIASVRYDTNPIDRTGYALQVLMSADEITSFDADRAFQIAYMFSHELADKRPTDGQGE